MFRLIVGLIILLGSLAVQAQVETVQWAAEVLEFSSEYDYDKYPKHYRAIQALGEPNMVPRENFVTAAAWAPSKADNPNGEWIKVAFANPTVGIQQLFISQQQYSDIISRIWLYDEEGKEYLVYQKDEAPTVNEKSKLFSYKIEPTTYAVKALKIKLETNWFKGFTQIDAIGIATHLDPVEIKINEIANAGASAEVELVEAANSEASELLPSVSPDGRFLYLVRQNHPENITPERQNIWVAPIDENDQVGTPVNVGAPLNTKNNSALLSITPDNQKALVLNVYNEDGSSSAGVSTTVRDGEKWTMPEAMIFDEFENLSKYGEYYLASSGNILVMSIMMTERIGAKDLYVSFWQEDKQTWSKPKNLGATLNTAASESAPFLAADGRTLYFSSKGHPGYGSQDVYVTTRLDDTWENWTKPQNLGPIINTPNYDSYYTLPASGNYAYFTRYTKPKGGHSEIYRIKLNQAQKPDPVVLLSGKVINAATKAPLKADIFYESLATQEQLGVAQSEKETGAYKIVLPAGDAYGFLAEAEGYIAVSQNLDLSDLEAYEERTMDLELIPIEEGQVIRLNNVFFETSKYNLKKAAELELNRLTELLERYPNMQIEVAGHTDSKGSDSYNKTLSQNRAKAVYNYLLEKDITKERVVYQGYGEGKPVADNETEEGRALNRRVEFKIIRVK